VEAGAPNDETLVHAVLDGDDDSFTELVRRHKRRIFAMGARFARDDGQLEDISQEIFIRAYRNLRKFRGDAPFEHWLSRLAVRVCYDFLRKNRRFRGDVPLEREDLMAAPETAHEAREVLDFALARLAPEERLVITLLELEDKSVREVAGLTGWSESNVKVRAFRAREALKKILEKSHER
jgi:RNA polymerase sigma-70 factor (ECF subfamily)